MKKDVAIMYGYTIYTLSGENIDEIFRDKNMKHKSKAETC
jgi:hypothetical protein